jgi:hypothetical protein
MIPQSLSRSGLLALGVFTASSFIGTSAAAQEGDGPWKFSGDARFRAEFNDTAGTSDRHRQRMRFRFGGSYTYNDEFTIGARAVTGNPADPRSPHVDLGGGLGKMQLNLDRLYVQYTPEWFDGAFVAGKFGNPVYRNPVYGELVWDADVQPEGLAVVYGLGDMGPFSETGFIGAQVAVLEQSASENIWATLLNWHGKVKRDDDSSIDLGVSYYHYGDLTPDGSGALLGIGNAVAGGEFVSDFGIMDAVVAYNTGDYTVSTEIIKNLRAGDGVGDSGYTFGGAMNTENGKFYYQFQSVETDAVMAYVSQDDFLYTNNHDSHIVGWKKPLMEKLGVHVWLMASEMEDDGGAANDTIYRFRIDFNFKF